MSGSPSLPEFDAPPLFETVLAVRFPGLKGWDLRHFGLFWDYVREDFPRFETKQPLAAPRTLSDGPPAFIEIQMLSEPDVRGWYLIPDGTRLLQLQRDAFIHNWRKVTLEETYPRYVAAIRPAFELEWSRFLSFLDQEGIDKPTVVESEVTYVNHFEQGREWSSMADLAEVVRWWSPNGPSAERIRLTATVPTEGHNLEVTLFPAVRRSDKKELIQLNLTVKGQPKSAEKEEILEWMDRARAVIVRGFADLTTEKMHRIWRRTK